MALVRSRAESGCLTSPKNLFLPNQLISHTLILSVTNCSSDSFILYWKRTKTENGYKIMPQHMYWTYLHKCIVLRTNCSPFEISFSLRLFAFVWQEIRLDIVAFGLVSYEVPAFTHMHHQFIFFECDSKHHITSPKIILGIVNHTRVILCCGLRWWRGDARNCLSLIFTWRMLG